MITVAKHSQTILNSYKQGMGKYLEKCWSEYYQQLPLKYFEIHSQFLSLWVIIKNTIDPDDNFLRNS